MESSIIVVKDCGSVEGGDYEVNENVFDLIDLLCVIVYKYQINIYVSLREFFLLKGFNIVKLFK